VAEASVERKHDGASREDEGGWVRVRAVHIVGLPLVGDVQVSNRPGPVQAGGVCHGDTAAAVGVVRGATRTAAVGVRTCGIGLGNEVWICLGVPILYIRASGVWCVVSGVW